MFIFLWFLSSIIGIGIFWFNVEPSDQKEITIAELVGLVFMLLSGPIVLILSFMYLLDEYGDIVIWKKKE